MWKTHGEEIVEKVNLTKDRAEDTGQLMGILQCHSYDDKIHDIIGTVNCAL